MRKKRNFPIGREYVAHVGSHLVEPLELTKDESELIKLFFRALCYFHGISVDSITLMNNHFHAILRICVRVRIPRSNKQLLRFYRKFYGKNHRSYIDLYHAIKKNNKAYIQRIKDKFKNQWCNIPELMKVFKTKVTRMINGMSEGRFGTCWCTRYFSRVIELLDVINLLKCAVYLAMNPVKAGMVKTPAEYGFSTYAWACQGDPKARAAIQRCASCFNFEEAKKRFENLFKDEPDPDLSRLR